MRGKSAEKPTQLPWWKVVRTREHGGAIHGARREVGDTFQAAESAMTFELLEGLVEQTADPGVTNRGRSKRAPEAGAAATETNGSEG